MFGQFSAPVLGMLAQSSAFGTVSQNIANVNTGGYKATDTRFSTILASTFDNNDDVGGLKTVRKNYISAQGLTLSTPNPLDLAINGRGFFVVNSQLDGSGDEFYTRDGAFSVATPTTGRQQRRDDLPGLSRRQERLLPARLRARQQRQFYQHGASVLARRPHRL